MTAGLPLGGPLAADPPTARNRPLRVALFGLFGRGNLGNDASLEAMLAFLRRERPQAEIVCICKEPEVVRASFGVRTLPIRWTGPIPGLPRRPHKLFQRLPARVVDLAHAVRHLGGADVMIVPGTGILDDFGERPGGMPFDILKWCVAARLTGTRLAFVSIGAGPIRNPRSFRMMVAAARLAHYRSYRDEVSRAFMAAADLEAPGDAVYPDLVFGLPAPEAVAAPAPPGRAPGGLVVGVGIMAYRGWFGFDAGGEAVFEAYLARMLGFIRHLLARGHRVQLLTGDVDDWPAVQEALARCSDAERAGMAAGPIASLHDLMRQIAGTDVVVATRFHNVVCALKLGKPTISLGYAEKNDALMTEMGLADLCHHIDRVELDELTAQFDYVVSARAILARDLRTRAEALRDRLARQEARLLAQLLR